MFRPYIHTFLLFFIFASTNAYAGDPLVVMTEDYPPLNYLEGDVVAGPSVEVVRLIQNKLKLVG